MESLITLNQAVAHIYFLLQMSHPLVGNINLFSVHKIKMAANTILNVLQVIKRYCSAFMSPLNVFIEFSHQPNIARLWRKNDSTAHLPYSN